MDLHRRYGHRTDSPNRTEGTTRFDLAITGARLQVHAVDVVAERHRKMREWVRSAGDQVAAQLVEQDELPTEDQLRLFLSETAVEGARDNEPGSTRGVVTGWSRKSRSNMLRTIAGLDLVGRWGMLTLTLPGDWWTVCDTPERAKAALTAFQKRWERSLGIDFVGVWKMEFQRRGAVHFHVGVQLPDKLDGLDDFVRDAWHEVLCHPGRHGRCDLAGCPWAYHRRHGAQLDTRYGNRIRQAGKAFASYFAKHGVWSTKEYQHQLPGFRLRRGAWLLAALGAPCDQLERLAAAWDEPGRWWGTRNVFEADTVHGELSDAEMEAARLVARKVIARRSWRYVEVEGSRPVLMRRSMISLHGDHGFWLLAGQVSEFMPWFLATVRQVVNLSGRERARFLATIEEPGARAAPRSEQRELLCRSKVQDVFGS